MIRTIAVMDNKRGLATNDGIPWDLPTDKKYFRQQTKGSTVLMGYNTYLELSRPFPDRVNLVASRPGKKLREGFKKVENVDDFLKTLSSDIWVVGGAGLFASTIDFADELYLTRVDGDFDCTKFFPPFEQDFERVSSDKNITENNISFNFEIWKRG